MLPEINEGAGRPEEGEPLSRDAQRTVGRIVGALSGAAVQDRPVTVAVVAASLDLLGGQGIQAQALLDNLREENVNVRMIPINPKFPHGLRWLRRFRYVRTLINQLLFIPSLAAIGKVDVVHVFAGAYFSFLLAPVPALVLAKLLRKRTVLNYHSGEAEDHLARWGVLVHPWLRLADAIVVPSEYLKDVFARFGYAVRVIPNVVDMTRFPYRERMPLQPRLLSMRNLEPYYAVDVILRAFALVQCRYPQATLTIGGYGSEERHLRCLVRALGLRGVRFFGRYRPEEAPALYATADIFLNASVVDNQPVSVLEAFASGLPVVSTATGDIGAMLQSGKAGSVVLRGDFVAMADAVRELLERPVRALDLVRHARGSLERFTWGCVRRDWADIYRGSGEWTWYA